uniref:Uncharacterized protein n=1 Tax=Arundo donax TaxID=35708 RepID=A0A0A9A5H4_ARUDO
MCSGIVTEERTDCSTHFMCLLVTAIWHADKPLFEF